MTAIAADWALLVVDLQNDFLDRRGYYGLRAVLERDPGWPALTPAAQAACLEQAAESTAPGFVAPAAERMVDAVVRAVAVARRAGRPIAFVRAVYDRQHEILPPRLRADPERSHFPCRPGSWGAAFVEPLRAVMSDGPADRERVFDKHTYDAFLAGEDLTAFLAETGATHLIVCGTETQTCVLASAQHAALLGYRTTILEDGVWSVDAQLGQAALEIFRRAFGDTCDLNALGSDRRFSADARG